MAIYVKKSDVYVTEQGWMWHSLDLSLAEARIFGYIYGLTNSKRAKTNGYKGGVRELAKLLKLDQGGISKVLRKLEDGGLITLTDGVYRSVDIVIISDDSVNKSDDSVNKSDDSVNSSVDSVNKSDDSVNKSDDSVNSPLYPLNKEINKEMKEANIARETLATQQHDSVDYSFEGFKQAFNEATDNRAEWAGRENACFKIWSNTPIIKCKYIVKRLLECKCSKTNPLFFLQDFVMPEPVSYFGKELARGVDYFIAIYNGQRGLYTAADVKLYEMQNPQPFEI